MNRRIGILIISVLLAGNIAVLAADKTAENKSQNSTQNIYPAAIFPFAERGPGAKDLGVKAGDILFALLAKNPSLFLVDRSEMNKTLQEHEINLSGMVTSDQAIQVGKIVGAKILITGSVIEADKMLHIVAKIIGAETTRVLGASVTGKTSDDFNGLMDQLAGQVGDTIVKQADQLVAKEVKMEDRIAALKQQMGNKQRPTVLIHVTERHVGQAALDPAAETELMRICKETGFEVLDKNADAKKADIVLEGEGFSEVAGRTGNLISVKARVEVKAVDRQNDKIIAADRQTAVVVDLTEQIAGKSAIQKAAADIAERLLPKLVK